MLSHHRVQLGSPLPAVSTYSPPVSQRGLTVCIQLVEDLYGIPKTAGSQTASQIGVSGFIDEFAQKADLKVCFLSLATSIHVLRVNFFPEFPYGLPEGYSLVDHIYPPDLGRRE